MSSTALHILLIEDSQAVALNIAEYFEGKGHIMDFAHDGPSGLEQALSQHYDVIVLDIMLPKQSGLEVCQLLRQKATRHIPVIMLTALDSLEHKVTGFDHGADDYLVKPFMLEELEVRCQALSRRHTLHTQHAIELGCITVDRRNHTVARNGQTLNLSSVNYRIVAFLAESYPRVVTRSELIQKIWGDDPTESDALRSHIYQIRNILDKPFASPILKTVHGVGFVLDIQNDEKP